MEALETQAQATQEKENAVTKQNMKYTMSSSRGIYLSVSYTHLTLPTT